MEDECHAIDVKLAAYMAIQNNQIDAAEFDEFVKNSMTIHELKYSISNIDEKIEMVNEAIISQVMKHPEK